MKTDIPSEVGTHVFERAGLGRAPFRCIAVFEKSFQAHPTAPVQCGGSCDYCGNGIITHCQIEGSDRRRFVVGIDCVRKTDDTGLIQGYKNLPEVRAKAQAARDAKSKREHAELTGLIAGQKTHLVLLPHPAGRAGCTLLDYAEWMLAHAGAKGRGETLRFVKKALGRADNLDAGAGELKLADIERQRAESARQRDAALQARQEAENARKALLTPLGDMLADNRGGFCDSLAADLRQGRVPQGKAQRLVLEILSKQMGRYGSKAFDAEYERLAGIIEQAEAAR